MKRVIVHHSQPGVRVRISAGHNFYIRARWGVRLGLIAEPPTEQRRGDNFFENVEEFVPRLVTPDDPFYLPCDPIWWEVQRLDERNVFTIIETSLQPSQGWNTVDTFQWAINHDPIANAGPDQLIALDAGNAVSLTGVQLDGRASTDPDLTSAVDPDPGPLDYAWSLTSAPDGAAGGGTALAASALPSTAVSQWLAPGAVVPDGERGVYTFDLTARDREPATIGPTRGQPAENTASLRVLLGSSSDTLAILAPTREQPYYGNYDDGVGVVVQYAIGDAVANHPAYNGSWVVRLSIQQRINSPYALPRPVNSVVYSEERISSDRIGSFSWNGLANHDYYGVRSTRPLTPVIGALDIVIELLDSNWQSTGVAVARQIVQQAIVLDLFRWRTPFDSVSFDDTLLSGTFMETGHAGYEATRFHGGIDLAPSGAPDFHAAHSGRYQRLGVCGPNNSNTVQLTRVGSHRTRYLHGDGLQMHGADALVLQGDRLGRMHNCGTPAVHLHFQVEQLNAAGGVTRVINPLRVLSMPDTDARYPTIHAVLVRAAPVAGAADLTLTGAMHPILGDADLVVLCRDNAHPGYTSGNGSFLTIYRMEVIEDGVAWPPLVFGEFDPAADTADDFYVRQGIGQYHGDVPRLYYLLYRRWNTAGYNRTGGPRHFEVRASDFVGRSATRLVTIGCDLQLLTPAASLQIVAAAPAPLAIQVRIINQLSGLDRDNVGAVEGGENFRLSPDLAPAGWTIAPTRSGTIAVGATLDLNCTIDPHGAAPAGAHAFEIIVSSDVIRGIGTRLPITVTVG